MSVWLATLAIAAVVPAGNAPTPPCPVLFTQREHRKFVQRVYARARVGRPALRHIHLMQHCSHSPHATVLMRRVQRHESHARKKRESYTPYGRWAIPWYVVRCESRGRNLPPNSAGASGYYQMIVSTWHALGGKTTHAYQAPKVEQDRLAHKLWTTVGPSQWDCA